MVMQPSKTAANRTPVIVITGDGALEETVHAAFDPAARVDLRLIAGSVGGNEDVDVTDASMVVIDVDAGDATEMIALHRLMARIGDWPPVVVVTNSFDREVARQLLLMRVADFLVKPVQPGELVRACARVAQASNGTGSSEAEFFTYLPAVGGAGVTTLAIQTALLLNNSGKKTQPATCLVDLDFQHGACAYYLDLEPRLDLGEVEPRPERLDRQLLEVMTTYHASGLAVIAAPSRPAEMRTFDPDLVTRLLDLVSSHFDYVVIDMPRTWFPWTDNVLLGSNHLFVVSEMTVPSLKHAKQLVYAIRERLGDGLRPQVIVNRFEQTLFGAGLRRSDVEQALGEHFAAEIPNDYRLVREAIDRGVPLDDVKAGNKITLQLKKLIAPSAPPDKSGESAGSPLRKKLGFSWARA